MGGGFGGNGIFILLDKKIKFSLVDTAPLFFLPIPPKL